MTCDLREIPFPFPSSSQEHKLLDTQKVHECRSREIVNTSDKEFVESIPLRNAREQGLDIVYA